MANNTKQTGSSVASLAAKTLNDPTASGIKKALQVQRFLSLVLRIKLGGNGT